MEQPRTVTVTKGQSVVAAFEETQSMAEAFHRSGLFSDVSDQFQAMVKIQKGRELGMQPMASMEAFHIIQKRLFLSAQATAALVRGCGYADYVPVETTAKKAAILFKKRTREGWIDLPVVEYTIDIAQARGLTQKSPEWKTDPGNMLFWRCMTRGVRRYFPELTMGIPFQEDLPPVTQEQFDDNVDALYGTKPPRTYVDDDGDMIDAETGEVVEPDDVSAPPPPASQAPHGQAPDDSPPSGGDANEGQGVAPAPEDDSEFAEWMEKVKHHCQVRELPLLRFVGLVCGLENVGDLKDLNKAQRGKVLQWLSTDGGWAHFQKAISEQEAMPF